MFRTALYLVSCGVPYDTAFEMEQAEMWAACVVFGELGIGLAAPRQFDWSAQEWLD